MAKHVTKRLSRQERYNNLIEATYTCVVRNGLDRTTIRDIADYAGVTFGLIRHYFANKEELIEATYSSVTKDMTQHARSAAAQAGPNPSDQLSAFITASLSGPFVEPQYLAFWSSFVGKVLSDARMKELHRQGFWDYRTELTDLVKRTLEQNGHKAGTGDISMAVIKVNSIIDGFWIEACLNVDETFNEDLAQAGVEAVGVLLNVDLNTAKPRSKI